MQTTLQYLSYSMNKYLCSQKYPMFHSQRVSAVRILEKIDHVITTLLCIGKLHYGKHKYWSYCLCMRTPQLCSELWLTIGNPWPISLTFWCNFHFSVIKIICFCTFHNTAQLSCHVQISNNIDKNGIPKQGIFNQILIMGKMSLVKWLPVSTEIFSYTAEEITGKIRYKGWNKKALNDIPHNLIIILQTY